MVIRSIIAILILGLSALYAGELRSSREFTTEIPSLERLPRELNGWVGEDFPMGAETARVLVADATLHRRFRRSDGAEVCMFIGYFAQQQVNSQIHSPRNCIPGGGWNVAFLQQERLDLDGDAHTASHLRIPRNERSQDVFYWFCTQGGMVAREYAIKWVTWSRTLWLVDLPMQPSYATQRRALTRARSTKSCHSCTPP